MQKSLTAKVAAAQKQVEGYALLAAASKIRNKTAGNFLTLFETRDIDGGEAMHAQLHGMDVPVVLALVDKDIKELSQLDKEGKHRGVIAYLKRFESFLKGFPKNDPDKVVAFLQDAAVPFAGSSSENNLRRVVVMLDHAMDEYHETSKEKVVLEEDAHGNYEYASRIKSALEFITGDQRKFASLI